MATGIKIRITAEDAASPVIDGVTKKVKGLTGGVVGGSRMMKSGFGRIGAAASRMGGMMRIAGIAGGAGLAALAAGAIMVGAKFEQSIANIVSIVPEGVAAFDELAATARHWGSTTAFSASQAAEGMYALASAGLAVGDIREAIGGTLMFAGAAATDLGSATETVVGALKMFGYEADQTNRVVNVFAAGIASSMLNAERLKEALAAVGVTASSAGMEIEQTVAVLGMLHNAGMMGSVAGTNLKNAIVRMLTPNAAMNKLLGETVYTGENLAEVMDVMRGNMDDVGVVYKAFGRIAAPAALAMMRAGGAAMGEMEKKVTGTRKAFEMYAIQMNTVNSKGKILKSQLQEIFIATFEQIKPSITGAMDAILNGMIKAKPYIVGIALAVQKFVKENGALIKTVLKFIGIGIALFAIIQIGITVFGALSTIVSVVIGVVQVLTGAVMIFGSVFGTILAGLFSPIGLVVAAVGLLAFAVYKAFSSVWDSGASLGENLSAGFTKLWEYIVSGFEWLADRITAPIYWALLWIADKVLGFADKIGFILDRVAPGISAGITAAKTFIEAELLATGDVVKTAWGETADNVGDAFGAMAGKAKSGFGSIKTYITETIARMKVMGDVAGGGIDMGGLTLGDTDIDTMSDADKKILAEQLEGIQTLIDAEDAAWMKIAHIAAHYTTEWLEARNGQIEAAYQTQLALAGDNAVKIAEAEIEADTARTEVMMEHQNALMEHWMATNAVAMMGLGMLSDGFDTFYSSLFDSDTSWRQRWSDTVNSMKRSFVRATGSMIKTWIGNYLKAIIIGRTAEKVAAKESKLEQAKLGAVKAYQAFASIPIIGPALGVIAAIAAFAFLMAFHTGGLIPGRDDNQMINAQGGEFMVQRSGINAETMPVIQHINATGRVPETGRGGNQFVFNLPAGAGNTDDIRDAVRERIVPILEEMFGTGEFELAVGE